jgi:hypothetical protein
VSEDYEDADAGVTAWLWSEEDPESIEIERSHKRGRIVLEIGTLRRIVEWWETRGVDHA